MQIFFINQNEIKGNRWDGNFWRPDYCLVVEQLHQFKFPLYKLKDVSQVNIGQSGKRIFIENQEVRYLVVGDLDETGVLLNNQPRWVASNQENDPERSRLEEGDLLFVISGGGSIGRVNLVDKLTYPINISQDIARVSSLSLPLFSTFLFFQTKWGRTQIHRFENGTGITHLNQEEVKNLIVPKFPSYIEEWSQFKVKKMNQLHREYLEENKIKKLKEAKEFKKNIVLEFEKIIFKQ